MGWIETTDEHGRPFLLNEATLLGFGQDAAGKAIAVSIAGAQIVLGVDYATIAADDQRAG